MPWELILKQCNETLINLYVHTKPEQNKQYIIYISLLFIYTGYIFIIVHNILIRAIPFLNGETGHF